MSVEPSSWPPVKLGDMLRHVARPLTVEVDGIYREIGIRSHGKGLFHKAPVTGAAIGDKRVFYVEPGDFVLNIVFAWEGAIGVVSDAERGMIASHRFPCFRAVEGGVDLHYLERFFQTPAGLELLGRVSPGGAGRNRTLNRTSFIRQEIPLPPLPEQQRIVARIAEVAGSIATAESLSASAVTASDALLYAALRRARLALMESSFARRPIGTAFRVTAGGTPSRDNPAFWNGTVPWIKTGELKDDDIEDAEEHITDAGVSFSSAKLLPEDTVLVALYGQGQTRGRTGRLRLAATTNQACCAIHPAPDIASARFVQYWLRSWYHELREQSQGGAQPNWNASLIKALPIVLPPLVEQAQAVAWFDALNDEIVKLKNMQVKARAELAALLPAVLDRAFGGAL